MYVILTFQNKVEMDSWFKFLTGKGNLCREFSD